MPYRLLRFKSVPLPYAMPKDDLSTAKVESSLRDSIGGVYNYFGSNRRFPRRQQFRHKGLYVGEVAYRVTSDGHYRITSDGEYRTTAANKLKDLEGKTNDLKAEIGNWGELWRERLSDGQLTYKWCRLLDVKHVEEVDNANVVSDVESEYETDDVAWRSEEVVTSSVNAVAGTAASLLVPNAGSIEIADAILQVTCTSGTITQIDVTGSGVDLTWVGSLASGQTLSVDSGDQTVPQGSGEEYDGLTFNAGHTSEEWLPLARGINLFQITVTGGNATVTMGHNDKWP